MAAGLATQKIRGLAAYRTLLLWPYGIAPAVAGIIFLFIFHPSYGILPYFLSFVTTYEFNWLLKGWVAMALVIAATAWTHLGYNIAFYIAGLLAIPASVLEAADVDGAGPIRRFTAIVLPLVSPITFYLVVLNMVFAFFESFGVIDAVTKGGPGRATEIMVYKALQGRLHRAEPGLLGRAVGDPDGHRDRADRAPVPLRREEGDLLVSAVGATRVEAVAGGRAGRARAAEAARSTGRRSWSTPCS